MTLPLPYPNVIVEADGVEALDPDGVQSNFEALAQAGSGVAPAFEEDTAASDTFADGATLRTITLGPAGVWVITGGCKYPFAGGARRGLLLNVNGSELARIIVPLVSNDTALTIARVCRTTTAAQAVTLLTSHDTGGSETHSDIHLSAALIAGD